MRSALGHVIGSFVRQEVSDKVSAAPGYDAPPILRIFLKCFSLKWVDLISESRRQSSLFLSFAFWFKKSRHDAARERLTGMRLTMVVE